MPTILITCRGRVQGVGFRPLVCRLAEKHALRGTVRNLGGFVEIRAEGPAEALKGFMADIRNAAEPVRVDSLTYEEIEPQHLSDFHADYSAGHAEEPVFPADIGICDTCLAELETPGDRHFHYPYTSCTTCGPRYTIIEKLPYDRENTTMRDMPLCADCAREYGDLNDRRCHGETISCNHCGPQLFGVVDGKRLERNAAMEAAVAQVKAGGVILVKAMGGYQLVCRGDRAEAVRLLRTWKHRGEKPFALMVHAVSDAEKLAQLSEKERQLLTSSARPIVLVRPKVEIPREVAADVPRLGLFLPSTGFYHLLTKGVGVPLVVTSANRSGEPMIFRDEEAENFFHTHEGLAGYFSYDRDILRPADDSVVQVVGGRVQLLRRTRGFLPEPAVDGGPAGQVLATGADMEPSFCLTGGGKSYPCQVSCELENESSQRFVVETEADWERMLGLTPRVVISDLHPGYMSTAWGKELARVRGIPFHQVQHHHAHALSVMAEHHLMGPCLAFVFDGTGYGTDGTIWGGEILRVEGTSMARLGHVKTIPMIGGDLSMKQAWKSGLCHLAAAGLSSTDPRYPIVKAALSAQVNTIGNSSVGRLFDAAAFLLGLKEENHFKAECPMALERAAMGAAEGTPISWKGKEEGGQLLWDPAPLWETLLSSHGTIEEKARGFHEALASMVVQSAEYFGMEEILFSGGCFQNGLLLSRVMEELSKRHFQVYTNEKVPAGDGGIALGQGYYGQLKSSEKRKA